MSGDSVERYVGVLKSDMYPVRALTLDTKSNHDIKLFMEPKVYSMQVQVSAAGRPLPPSPFDSVWTGRGPRQQNQKRKSFLTMSYACFLENEDEIKL